MVIFEKLNPSHCKAAGPSRSRGHGRPRFFKYHHSLLLLIVPVKQCNGLHSCKELLQKIAFVWRVNCVALQSEAHQKRINLQDSLQIRKDRNRTATTRRYRLNAINLSHSLFCSLIRRR